MRTAYWMLGVLTFTLLLLACFFVFPVTLILLALILGAVLLYFDKSTSIADKMIAIGSYTWKHWLFFLFILVILTISFVLITDLINHSRKFQHIKVRPKKR